MSEKIIVLGAVIGVILLGAGLLYLNRVYSHIYKKRREEHVQDHAEKIAKSQHVLKGKFKCDGCGNEFDLKELVTDPCDGFYKGNKSGTRKKRYILVCKSCHNKM